MNLSATLSKYRGLRQGLSCIFNTSISVRYRLVSLCSSRFFSNKTTNIDLSGIFPPIPTPFDRKEHIAYKELELNFSKWNEQPFKGYLIQGSNGEYNYLSNEERVELVKKSSEMISKDKLLIVGSGCESTKETIALTNKMADVGAQAAMVVTPCYYKSGMKDKALVQHYEELANKSDIPIILYNVPAYTGVELSIEAISILARHDNIIGIKESGGDITKIGSILYSTRNEDFQVLAGSTGFLLPALRLGCVGGVNALANVLGKEVCELFRLFLDGKDKEANNLQKQLLAPNNAITKMFGVPGLKYIMDQKGYYGGITRMPLQPLEANEGEKLKNIFTLAGFL